MASVGEKIKFFNAFFIKVECGLCPGGEIGRHKGLKIPRLNGCAGSTPAPGTSSVFLLSRLCVVASTFICFPTFLSGACLASLSIILEFI